MRCLTFGLSRRWFATIVLCVVCGSTGARGEQPDPSVAELLAAGRLEEAMQVARGQRESGLHDASLAQISTVQAERGDRRAAAQSASEIRDESSRAKAVKRLRGGGGEADFEAIMELITSTIAPNSWDDVGGPGAVKPFAGGVYVDAAGVMKPITESDGAAGLDVLKRASRPVAVGAADRDVRRSSRLRKVSLPRLERRIQFCAAAGVPLDEALHVLAGLQRIEYLFVYPETGDLVLAGPAEAWRRDKEHRVVGVTSGQPALRLEDLIVVLRHMLGGDGRFGCSITPTQENLARTRAFLQQSGKQSLRPGQRDAWLDQLRQSMGKQTIEYWGLDPQSRAARVLVEADYRMKLVGMGLEDGVLGVTDYLHSIQVAPGEAPPPMDVLRWWFTLNYDAVSADAERQAFAFHGQGVQVLSENELLTARGERVHTGKSDALNQQFAHSFTRHFPALCQKYPIYADLRNVFDLALVGAVIRAENLRSKAGWRMLWMADPEAVPVRRGTAPRQVETVINHRVIHRIHIVAGVSGGVSVDASPLVAPGAIKTDTYGKLTAEHQHAALRNDAPDDVWWWD